MYRLLLLFLFVSSLAGSAFAQGTRDVTVDAHAVVRVSAKVRFTTMIVLPEGEEILDVVCGDKDFWVISGAQNLAYVKPAKTGITTNLNLITATGHIYSFVLTESATDPDLKIYVATDRAGAPAAGPSRLYSAAQVEQVRHEAEAARQEADAAREAASQAMDAAKAAGERAVADADQRMAAFRSGYPMTLEFPYRFQPNLRPFFVSAIFTDGRCTYIRMDGHELPTLYEVRDRTPNLVNFEVQGGLYVVPKVLEAGYLVIGKHRFEFDRLR
jgi:type IV secretory pathway VirB9-like protein